MLGRGTGQTAEIRDESALQGGRRRAEASIEDHGKAGKCTQLGKIVTPKGQSLPASIVAALIEALHEIAYIGDEFHADHGIDIG
jgi:hypothetical protein